MYLQYAYDIKHVGEFHTLKVSETSLAYNSGIQFTIMINVGNGGYTLYLHNKETHANK